MKRVVVIAISVFIGCGHAVADCYAAYTWTHANELGVSPVLYNTAGYTEVPCAPVEGERTAVIIVLGQSLGINSVSGAYTPTHTKNQQLNTRDAKCYQAKGAALGVPTMGASYTWFGSRLGDELINRGIYDRVVMVPMSIGGTYSSEWANTTTPPWIGRRIGNVACMLQSAGLRPTHVVWMQGEADSGAQISQSGYAANLSVIINDIRAVIPTTTILVNKETWRIGGVWAPVQAAQMGSWGSNGVIAGANMDSLNNSYRYDGTHLNASGALAASNLLADIIAANQ